MKSSSLRATLVKMAVGALIAVSLILIFYFSAAITSFIANVETLTKDAAKEAAGDVSENIGHYIDKTLGEFKNGLKALDGESSLFLSSEALSRYVGGLISGEKTSGVVTARYFRGDKEYYLGAVDDTFIYKNPESEQVLALAQSGEDGYTSSLYEYETLTDKCMAFGVNTAGNDYIDYVVIFVKMEALFPDITPLITRDDYELTCLASGSGGVIKLIYSDEVFGKAKNTNNIITMLTEVSNDTKNISVLEQAINKGNALSSLINIGGDNYAAAFSPVETNQGRLYVVQVYDPEIIYAGSYEFIAKLGGATVMLVIIYTIIFAVVLAIRGYYRRQLYKSDNIDPVVGCKSFKKFSIESEDILSINLTQTFAVLFISLENHAHIKSTYGESVATDTLVFIGRILDRFVAANESYSYVSENKFSALIRYNKPEETVNRIKIINALAGNFPALKSEGYSPKLGFGVYAVKRGDGHVIQPLLEKAMLAYKTKLNTATTETYLFYDDSMGRKEERVLSMERRAESSLKNGEFRVFYQPKLNIKLNRIDGAEALARWYDTGDDNYILPNEFVPLFENNGFISTLDRFMFEEVCRYLSDSIQKGRRIVPVSVNVSRVTAMQEGFLEFYIATKEKYEIADGYLAIEFTESFAQQNYEALRKILLKLRANGFKTSIDDFGSGYASYSVLKELPVDELKLDQFFIKPGADPNKDDVLLKSIITLALDLGMKITQEGVEKLEDIDRLKEMGCTVVQGFFYSRPLPKDVYTDFVATHIIKQKEI